MNETMRTGACYIRVSTDKQEELSPDAQKRLLLEYARQNDILIDEKYIYMENGISGRRASKRPEFQRMIATVKDSSHPVDVILVWKFSRFARNQEESIVYKSLLRKQCNVDVISISEPLVEGPFGSLIERIIEWMDEYYSIRLSGEVIRGMTEKALRGGYQATAPLGYRSLGSGKPPEVIPEEADVVRRIFYEFVTEGRDRLGIARGLNEDGYRTKRGNLYENRVIDYILQNPFYIGKVRWNNAPHGSRRANSPEEIIVAQGKHTAIIDEATFNQAQEKLAAFRMKPRRRSASSCKHWLSGLLVCSSCGSSLGYNRNPSCPFFTCWKFGKGQCATSHNISARKAEQAVLNDLRRILDTGVIHYTQHPSQKSFDSPQTAQKLQRIELKLQRAKDAYINGIDNLEEYRDNKRKLEAERQKLLTLNQTEPAVDTRPVMLARVRNVADILESDSYSGEQKGNAIRSIVEKIVLVRPGDELHFYYYFS